MAEHQAERTVRGLDSIRFWCALWVYFSHFGFVPLTGLAVPKVFVGIYNNLFCGVGAVIAFFVISGFCIHYPFVNTARIPLRAFYVRRYIRILCPLLIALLIGAQLGEDMTAFYQTIIWSLVAELIYYTIYPAIRVGFMKWGRASLVVAYAAAALAIALRPRALNFHDFGPQLTWLVGLPSWLLGCQLAVTTVERRECRINAPWFWRGAVWITSSAASMLRFHANIGYPATLTLFGILVFFWLREEVRYFRRANPPRFAEFCGKWSYSMYLVHGLAALGFARLGFAGNAALGWVAQTAAVLAASFCFYLAIERPSHRLARTMARLVRRPEMRAVEVSGASA